MCSDLRMLFELWITLIPDSPPFDRHVQPGPSQGLPALTTSRNRYMIEQRVPAGLRRNSHSSLVFGSTVP